MSELKKCLYCDNMTDEPHFASDCCGRGMCDECYGNNQGTDEQIQMDFVDDEDLDRMKPEFKSADFLCFECVDIWQDKTK